MMLAALLIAPALIGYAQQAPPGASQPDEGLAGALSERGIPGSIIAGVPSQKLDADVLVVQPTENWNARNGAELLRAPEIRRILVQ
jgi:hypothetical protein